MMAAERRRYRFGNVDVDLSNLKLSVYGAIRPLEPKAFRVLQFLMENPGRAIAKVEILAAVWTDVAVTGNALTRAIAQLRKALGDDSIEPRFIETVPTVGYRFLARPDPVRAAVPVVAPVRLPKMLIAGMAVLGLGIAAYAIRQTGEQPSIPSFQTNAQITSSDGLDLNAVFSPDGHQLAYSSDRTGAFEVYVRPLDGGGRETQVTSNRGGNLFPSFSPDGQAMAYSALRNTGIYRAPPPGGAVERLTRFGAQPVWSPDGKWIVFLSHGRPTLNTTDFYWPGVDSSLSIVAAGGGEPREITPHAKIAGGQAFPSWSRDGLEVRFVNYDPRGASLWTYRLDGETLQKRFEMPRDVTLGSATFSRDSRRLYYISSRLNGDIAIWVLPLHPVTLTPAGDPVTLYRPSLGTPRDLAISPNGERLAFSAILNKSQILIQDLKMNRPVGDPVDVSRETGYRYNMPVWSPDGRAVVYTKLPIGRPAQSWLNRLDGSPSVAIGRGVFSQHYPSFQKNGTVIRSLLRTPGGLDEMQDVGIEDGSITTTATNYWIAQPSFSPDGESVSFHSQDPVHQVWKLDIATGKRTQMTFGGSAHGFANYSYDGAWIEVQRLNGGNAEVWVLPYSGGKLEPVISQPGTWFAGGSPVVGRMTENRFSLREIRATAGRCTRWPAKRAN